MITVDTTTSTLIRANGRKVAVTSAGRRWAALHDGSTRIEFWYSDDAGATWTENTSARMSTTSDRFAFFIDADDHAHLAALVSGVMTCFRMASIGTSTSWNTTVGKYGTLVTSATATNPDVVAHPHSTGWRAHVTYEDSGDVFYARVAYASNGDATVESGPTDTLMSGVPSIDFHHTGNGRTVKSSAPHVYICTAGANPQFIAYVYTSGNWTTVGRVLLDSRDLTDAGCWIVCAFDGTRVVMPAVAHNGSGYDTVIYERDASDTVTTVRTLATSTTVRLDYGSGAVDTEGNVYLAGHYNDGSDRVGYRKWTRSTNTLATVVQIDASGRTQPNLALKRHSYTGSSGARWLEGVYVDGAGSPFNVEWYGVNVNIAPTAPTWLTAAGVKDIDEDLVLSWAFSDADASDTQAGYRLKRTIGATTRWWDGTDWDAVAETDVVSSTSSTTIPAGWGADADANHVYAVATQDSAGSWSSYSANLTVTPDEKDPPVVTAPTGTIGVALPDVEWTVTDQGMYRAEILQGGTTVWDSGIVVSTAGTATVTTPLANSTAYTARVTTWTAEGLSSGSDTEAFSTSFTPPETPTLVVAEDPAGALEVTVTNPDTGEAVTSNDLFVRVAAGGRQVGDRPVGGDGLRIGTGLAEDVVYTDWLVTSGVAFEYKARAWAANGAYADSAWTA